MEATRLRVNAPNVIHETIDGEVIIINLASGNYYSVKGCGADVWDVIQQSPGTAVPDIAAVVAARFDHPRDQIETEVLRFIGDLRDEGLIADEDAAADRPTVDATTNGQPKQPFAAPVLEKYTDMQDLVLLDPVHEVDAAGWPEPRPDAPVSGSAA